MILWYVKNVWKNLKKVPTPMKIEIIHILMKTEKYKKDCETYFLQVLNDNNLESEYININDNIYSIYMCEMDNITYLVSKIEYKSLEFKKLFNFKDDFSNFYKGKIVKII